MQNVFKLPPSTNQPINQYLFHAQSICNAKYEKAIGRCYYAKLGIRYHAHAVTAQYAAAAAAVAAGVAAVQ